MKRNGVLFAASGGLLVVCLVSYLVASEPAKSKEAKYPNPVKTLQTAIKNLAKSGNYYTKVTIEGGISGGEDHSLVTKVVAESYEGEVHGSLMQVASPKAYRYPKKGVALVDGHWVGILSDQKTKLVQKLFTFPEVILGRALTHAPRGAKWLPPQETDAKPEAKAEEGTGETDGEVKEEPAGKSPRDKTVVAKSGAKKGAEPSGPQPRIIRVEAPSEEALQHFLEVQNSGCLSAG